MNIPFNSCVIIKSKFNINTSLSYRNVIKALKEKNVDYHTYQFKKDKSYKVMLGDIHSKINIKKLSIKN